MSAEAIWSAVACPDYAGPYYTAEARREALLAAGIPVRYLTASLASPQATTALAAARTFVTRDLHRGRALVLLGPTGVGKTYAACAAALVGFEYRWRVRFEVVGAWLRAMRSYATQEDAWNDVQAASLLVLDDLGVPRDRQDGDLLDELVAMREAASAATIVTSNLTPEALGDAVSDRMVDRLATWATRVQCAGPSLRTRPAEAAP